MIDDWSKKGRSRKIQAAGKIGIMVMRKSRGKRIEKNIPSKSWTHSCVNRKESCSFNCFCYTIRYDFGNAVMTQL